MDFDRPVHIGLGKLGMITYAVNDPLNAADILLNKWPAVTGARHVAARRAVLVAMERALDVKATALARKAFEDAAIEADILRPPPLRRA